MGKYCEKFKKGSLELLLLKLLSGKDLYGYEIVQLFNEISNNVITISPGNMYPTLYKLEDKGFITSYKKLVGKRMERIYYHLTDIGRQELEEMLSDYQSVITATANILNYKYDVNQKEA